MDDALQVQIEQTDSGSVLHVAGEVDVASASILRDALESLPSESPRVVVDLSEVSFLDSTGLGVLVGEWKRSGEDTSARFCLVVTRPEIKRVLEVTGLTSIFSIYDSLPAAIES
jgi:anti-sigma B factor antagonist